MTVVVEIVMVIKIRILMILLVITITTQKIVVIMDEIFFLGALVQSSVDILCISLAGSITRF